MIIALTVCVIVLALTVMYIMFTTDKRIDNLEEDFLDDDGTIDDLCEVLNDNSKDIEEAVNEHAESLDSLEGFSSHLSLKLGAIEEKVNALEEDITETLESVDDNRDNLHTTGEILEGMEDRLEEVEENTLSHSERLSRLEESMLENELEDAQLREKVEDLKENEEFIYDTLSSYMDDTETAFNKTSKAIKFMSSAILENWKSINTLCDLVAKLKDRLDSTEGDLEYVKTVVGEEIDTINERLDGFDIEVDYIEKHLHELDKLAKETARKYERDEEKKSIDDLWRITEDHCKSFTEATDKKLPSSIIEAEYELYTKYFEMASSAQKEYERKLGEEE